MRRIVIGLLLIAVAGMVSAQELYTERLLRAFELSDEQIAQILRVNRDTENEIRLLNADLDIKKAELARLLVDEEPNMRAVQRNLSETADIQVHLRMLEIRREMAIRGIVGTEKWARIMQAIRIRRQELELQQEMERAEQEARDAGEEDALRAEIQERLRQVQETMRRLAEQGEAVLSDPGVREQLRQTEEDIQSLMENVRDAVQDATREASGSGNGRQ